MLTEDLVDLISVNKARIVSRKIIFLNRGLQSFNKRLFEKIVSQVEDSFAEIL